MFYPTLTTVVKDKKSYVKFTHLFPSLPGFIDIYVGGKMALKDAYFGKSSHQFVEIKSGENRISVFSGPKEIFSETINFNPKIQNICVFSNMNSIFKLENKPNSQILNVIDEYGPLFCILDNTNEKLQFGIPKNLYSKGHCDLWVKDIKGKTILQQKIKNDHSKVFIIGGNIKKGTNETLGIYEIENDQTKYILDVIDYK